MPLTPVPENEPPAGEPPPSVCTGELIYKVSNGRANVTTGNGFTVTENCMGELVQLPFEATTVNMDVNGVVPAFVVVNEGIFPVPLVAPIPIASLVLLQEYVEPDILLQNTIDGASEPTQYALSVTGYIFGVFDGLQIGVL